MFIKPKNARAGRRVLALRGLVQLALECGAEQDLSLPLRHAGCASATGAGGQMKDGPKAEDELEAEGVGQPGRRGGALDAQLVGYVWDFLLHILADDVSRLGRTYTCPPTYSIAEMKDDSLEMLIRAHGRKWSAHHLRIFGNGSTPALVRHACGLARAHGRIYDLLKLAGWGRARVWYRHRRAERAMPCAIAPA
jgi:hypothetical protein